MKDSVFTPEQAAKIGARLGREVEAWLSDHTVEPQYSPERVAELLEVSLRTVAGYKDDYETSAGRSGLGPWIKYSHKVTRIKASSLNRFIDAHTVAAAPALEGVES